MFNAIQYQKQQATFYETEKDFEFFEPLYSAAINIYNRKNKVEEKNIFEPLKKELFSVMIKHFELLFTGDINGFRKDVPYFDDAMNRIYKKYGKMKSEAYLSKPFIQLIRERK